MASTIITKNSSTSSAVPASGDLVQGELAVNVTDKKIFTKDSSGTVVKVVGQLGNQEPSAVAITGGTVAGVAQTGGTINNTPIGATTAAAITGTLITATTGFSGPLTGAVTGNTTGTHTGAVTGNVTGNLTGNVTASSGSSTFNNVTINGTLDMDAASSATITNLPNPTNSGDAANKAYVDAQVSAIVDGAPAALDTLNELAAALNDDASFSTTVTNSIAAKLPLAGGTMTGNIAMGTNKVTGLGTPSSSTDAATKGYVDTATDLKLNLSGGTMSGAIAMGSNKITGLGTPTANGDATTKSYVDGILGSATAAATSAAAAATSETNAGIYASASADSASSASASASAAAASYDAFDDRYLGNKSSSPSVDNDGNALLTGALYFDTVANEMRVYTGSAWKATGSAVNGTSSRQTYTATASQTIFAIVYDVGYVDVYLNGVKQLLATDFTATSGTDIVFATGLTAGDIVDIVAYGAFEVANTYTQAQADARFQAYDSNLTSFVSAFTLPTSDGTSTQVLQTDGSGTLSFATISATPFSNSTALAQVQATSLCF